MSRFSEATTVSLGNIVLPVEASLVTLNVRFSVAKDRYLTMLSWDNRGYTR